MSARSSKVGGSADFVYFEDTGSIYDAPIDILWDFMNDDEFHPEAHRGSLRNLKWKKINEITSEANCEVVRGGRWVKMKARITTVPPLVRVDEEFEGAYAGLKMVFLYTPEGNKTGVDVYVRAPKAVVDELREALANAFREDIPMLRAFIRKRRLQV
jgi:hypothetical protein